MKSQKLSWAECACGKASVGLRLHGMNDVGKLDRILDEEDRDVVADDVPVAFLGIELDGKAAHVAGKVERAFRSGDRREADEGGRLLAGALEDVGARVFGQRFVGLENSHARHSPARAQRARECARGRSEKSSRGNESPRSASDRARRSSTCSDRRKPDRPGPSSGPGRRLRRSDAVRLRCRAQLLIMDRRGLARRLSGALGHADIPRGDTNFRNSLNAGVPP